MLMNVLLPAVSATVTPAAPYRHLVVLQHGLYGSDENLIVLAEHIQSVADDVLVHLAASNDGTRTRDGIAAGGSRLADEIRHVRDRHSSLEKISLVGNSLGGLYVRYAATALMDSSGQTMAGGLIPDALVTTGCPHLGVRKFTFLPLPVALQTLARPVAGQSGVELMLRDSGGNDRQPLLVLMSDPASAHGAALRAFRRRRCYACLAGDFMVPFGSAAFEAKPWAAGIGDGKLVEAFTSLEDATHRRLYLNDAVCQGECDGIGIIIDALLPASERADDDKEEMEGPEDIMARGLAACGPWSKVGVRFRSATTRLPMAHNRLAALRRPGWRRAFEFIEQAHRGQPIMEHCAQFIASDAMWDEQT